MADVTQILSKIEQGDPGTAEDLLPLVYDELRKLAAARIQHEQPGQTLQATGLVHEAYMRLVDTGESQRWESRGHFFGAAAEAMRRILIDRARSKATVKHGGEFTKIDFDSANLADNVSPSALLEIDEAIDRLKVEQPIAAKLVSLRYFAGFLWTMPRGPSASLHEVPIGTGLTLEPGCSRSCSTTNKIEHCEECTQ